MVLSSINKSVNWEQSCLFFQEMQIKLLIALVYLTRENTLAVALPADLYRASDKGNPKHIYW